MTHKRKGKDKGNPTVEKSVNTTCGAEPEADHGFWQSARM